jgi:hypothetical protein
VAPESYGGDPRQKARSRLDNVLDSTGPRCERRRGRTAVAVPLSKLQRNFVWDARRAAKLLDSMYKNMPIGSVFLWEMDRKSANLIRQSADVLPSFDRGNRHVWFVVDGQQRLSVLHQAFEGLVRQNDAGREIDFGRLCLVIDPEPTDDSPSRVVYRKPVDREFIPIKDILAPDWRRRIANRTVKVTKEIRRCRQLLLAYPIPVVTVQSATLEEIGEVFIRVNSQGMRISSADRAVALMGKLDIRAMAQELRDRVREVLAIGGIEPILMGFNLVAEKQNADGDPPRLEAMARRWSKLIDHDDAELLYFRKTWDRYSNAFASAVDYLRNAFPVYDESYLPSANMLATLAVFFYEHRGQPDAFQKKEIRKWFWATGVGQRYTGRGYHRNIVADAKWFKAIAAGTRKPFPFSDRLDPVADIQMAEYGSRSALARAFFCLLAARGPKYFENGGAYPQEKTISHANRKHRHHIFPQAQLRAHVSSKVYNSLCNICFLVSRENLGIGKRLPRKYLRPLLEKNRRAFYQVMRSHLIPAEADAGVWHSGVLRAFKQFRRERLELIYAAFEAEAGIRLFRRGV